MSARSRRLGVFALALFLPISFAQADSTLITNITVVSPEHVGEQKGKDVRIRDGKIVSIGKRGAGGADKGETVLDGKGLYLIPGLIDAHVHLVSVPGIEPGTEKNHRELISAYEEQLPRSYLYFGYTTVVDLNVVDRSALDRFKSRPLHPDLYDCDNALVLANGYPMNYAPSPARFEKNRNFLYDERQKDRIPARYKASDHTPEAAVARVKAAGGICVKSHYEKGFGADRNLPTLTPELAARIKARTTQLHIPFLLHANSYEAQRFGVDNRVDLLAHGLWRWDGAEPWGLLDEVVAKGIAYMPTAQVLAGLQALFDPKFLDDPHLGKILPESLIAFYKSDAGRWFEKEIAEGQDRKAAFEGFNVPLERLRKVVAYLVSKKATFVFGTDTPSSPTYGNPPGYNGFLEMKRLHDYGVSLEELLRSASLRNAETFHLDQEIGTIEAGKTANLVLLKKNPLKTVDAYDAVAAVIVRGKVVNREALAMPQNR